MIVVQVIIRVFVDLVSGGGHLRRVESDRESKRGGHRRSWSAHLNPLRSSVRRLFEVSLVALSPAHLRALSVCALAPTHITPASSGPLQSPPPPDVDHCERDAQWWPVVGREMSAGWRCSGCCSPLGKARGILGRETKTAVPLARKLHASEQASRKSPPLQHEQWLGV